MQNEFICPHCLGRLVVDDSLVLSVAIDSEKWGLVFLNPGVGNYGLKKNDHFPLEDGMELQVFCPICHEDLQENSVHPNLVRLILEDKDGVQSDLYFSGIRGERSTFKIKEKKVEPFGDDAGKYIDFFNLSQNL